jgi:hypothetical protein
VDNQLKAVNERNAQYCVLNICVVLPHKGFLHVSDLKRPSSVNQNEIISYKGNMLYIVLSKMYQITKLRSSYCEVKRNLYSHLRSNHILDEGQHRPWCERWPQHPFGLIDSPFFKSFPLD